MLKIENVYKNFGTTEVLKGLNLAVQEGSVFGLVGVNGAGKSTLLRLISGVYEADQGTVSFNDHDTFRDPNIRQSISFVSDEPYYPINDERNTKLYNEYRELAEQEGNVVFAGRLGGYKYYDMDKAIAAAFDLVESELGVIL